MLLLLVTSVRPSLSACWTASAPAAEEGAGGGGGGGGAVRSAVSLPASLRASILHPFRRS